MGAFLYSNKSFFLVNVSSSRDDDDDDDNAQTVFTVSARERKMQPKPAFSVSFS